MKENFRQLKVKEQKTSVVTAVEPDNAVCVTLLGTFYLKVPKIRESGCVSSFIKPYQRSEKALLSTIDEICFSGSSTIKKTRI